MKYLCLGYFNSEDFDQMSATEKDAVMEPCWAQCKVLRATGKILAEEGLHSPKTSKTVRTRGGRLVITDGPFIETKEQLGSFFIVEADSLDEAIQVAALHPAAIYGEEFGFGIEVRQISE